MPRPDDIPRRSYMPDWTPAEHAIAKAIAEVEAMAADARLTDAVVLLAHAKAAVADYIDGVQGTRRFVQTQNESRTTTPTTENTPC